MSWPAPIRKPIKPKLYYSINLFAELAGMKWETMRKWADGQGVTREIAGRKVISSYLVRRHWPELYERLMEFLHRRG